MEYIDASGVCEGQAQRSFVAVHLTRIGLRRMKSVAVALQPGSTRSPPVHSCALLAHMARMGDPRLEYRLILFSFRWQGLLGMATSSRWMLNLDHIRSGARSANVLPSPSRAIRRTQGRLKSVYNRASTRQRAWPVPCIPPHTPASTLVISSTLMPARGREAAVASHRLTPGPDRLGSRCRKEAWKTRLDGPRKLPAMAKTSA